MTHMKYKNYKCSPELSSECQKQYDRLIDYINNLPLDDDTQQCLIDRIDDLVTWIVTEI